MRYNAKTALLTAAVVLLMVAVPALANTTYTIYFDLNGVPGQAPEPITVASDERISLPQPEVDGYIFAGWFRTPEGHQYTAFDSVVGADLEAFQDIEIQAGQFVEDEFTVEAKGGSITLYAQWIPADHIRYITTTDGNKTVTLGYSISSGVQIRRMDDNSLVPEADLLRAVVDYPVFKDLNKNGVLDPYEDWRLDVDTRSADLARQMSDEEIAGLMLYSRHQRIGSTTPTQEQVAFLANDNVRHILNFRQVPVEISAEWTNAIQAISERIGLGIPANNSSDPRHSPPIGYDVYSDNTGHISIWPNSLGLAATFDPDLVFEYGKIASAEYRALGITTALSPMIDIATDPRWSRFNGTFGEDPRLSADMTAAYVQGFQGTFDEEGNLLGWGYDSVNAMIKHWPGGGAGEAGRDGHTDYGKYAVYPGNNFDAHLVSFVDGALQGTAAETTMATAVMPYYTIPFNINPAGKDVANAYNEFILVDLLRNRYGFDGVICTDWGVDTRNGWGPEIEELTTAERSKLLIEAGVDQFGGQNTSRYILEAIELAKAEGRGEEFRRRMEESAVRLLKNIFRPGLFENPYLDVERSKAIAANEEFMAKGYEAQLKSIVMLKNKNNVLPLARTTRVYVPTDDDGNKLIEGVSHYFVAVDRPELADVAIVPLNSPKGSGTWGGWDSEEGYIPLALQFAEYTAVHARDVSIAGDYRNIEGTSKILNRTYKNKQSVPINFSEYMLLLETKEAMGDKPVIAVINMDNPMVFTEIDAVADAILVRFTNTDQAVLDIISGAYEPSGLLPMQMPKNMAAVEAQFEDVPRDLEVYIDSEGNAYDFAFGLNWSGVINDERVARYNVPPVTAPKSGPVMTAYPRLKTHTLPVGRLGAAYFAKVEVIESNAKVRHIGGKLPAGLTFADGIISGVPQELTHPHGEQLMFQISAPGKQDRIVRITLLVTDEEVKTLPDPNELSIYLTLASVKREENYTAESWAVFAAAYEAAQAVYGRFAEASQGEIDLAAHLLADAMAKLVRK